MAYDFSKAITRETNTIVNKSVNAAIRGVSTSINTGIGNSLTKGTEKLLSDIGAPPAIRQAIRNINAEVVNAGVKSAGDIVQGIMDGVFTSDILSKFSSLDVVSAAMKRKDQHATNMLNLNILAGAARTLPRTTEDIKSDKETSPYAVDYADIFTPKMKFLFLVEFVFNPPFGEESLFKDSSFHTVIYKFERPKIDIEHEEVNLYNFNTHVPKMIKYQPASFVAHDDSKNSSLSVLVAYLRTISPVFNIDSGYGMGVFEDRGGLAYDKSAYSANFGSLQQHNKEQLTESMGGVDTLTSIIREIRVYQVYDFGQAIDVYSFFNPKITSVQMDSLDMTENGLNSITCEFVYDGMYVDVGKKPTDSDIPKFAELNQFAQYNMVNRDVEGGVNSRAQQIKARDNAIAAQGKNMADIDRINNKLNDETFYAGETDYDRNQQIADAAYEKGLQNPNTLPSISVDSVVKGVKGVYTDVTTGVGKLFK